MYDHDIGLDWAQKVMAIARMTKKARKLQEYEGPSDIEGLRAYLKNLKGSRRLVLEESTASQWLYTELKDCVTELIVCDPRRNLLLSEGPKSDMIDAKKLVRLLRADMIKPVYHSGDDFICIRKLVSGYTDLVQAGVRVKNQRSALFRAFGKDHRKESALKDKASKFVLKVLDESINTYEENKKLYEIEFERLHKKHKILRVIKSAPGLGLINSVKFASIVVDPHRFPNKSHFLAFCGLIKYEDMSGGRCYGKRKTNYNRTMKNIFDTAAMNCIQAGDENFLKKEYLYLIEEKRLTDYNARHAIARRAALIAWGLMKSQKNFDINKRRKDKAQKNIK